MLNDDLQDCGNQIQTIKYENTALQGQGDVYQAELQRCQDTINHLKKRYVPRAKDPGKDNIVMIIEKNTIPEEDEFYEYPYCIVRIQRRFINTKKRWFKAQYPNHRFIMDELDNPNGIHAFNRFEEEGFVERFQCYFRLIDLTREDLYTMAVPAILDDDEK